MGVLDKFLDVMKVNDDDYDEEYMDDDEEFEDEEPHRRSLINRDRRNRRDEYDEEFEDEPVKPARRFLGGREERPSKVTPIRESEGSAPKRRSGNEICLMRPTSYEDSRTIAETIIGNSTVLLNLEGLDIEIAQRIIDFASGACFALGGNLQKVSQYIFLLTPSSVDISGDVNDLIGDGFASSFGKTF